jgi:hypothetical protein
MLIMSMITFLTVTQFNHALGSQDPSPYLPILSLFMSSGPAPTTHWKGTEKLHHSQELNHLRLNRATEC